MNYNLLDISGHIVFENSTQEWILVDTGSPTTISRNSSTCFMDQTFPCSTSFPSNINVDSISSMLGIPIDVLMGLDILSNYCIGVDLTEKLISFSCSIDDLKEKYPWASKESNTQCFIELPISNY